METQFYSESTKILTAFCISENLPSEGWLQWIPALYKENGEFSSPEIWKHRTPNGIGTLTAYVFPDGKVRIKNDGMKIIASTEVIA